MKIISPAIPLALMGMCFLSTLAFAQTDPARASDESATKDSLSPHNWQLRTLGGMQFWTDVRHFSGWRIQQNSETGHFRLIDPSAIRFAFGDCQQCDAALSKIVTDEKDSPIERTDCDPASWAHENKCINGASWRVSEGKRKF